MSESPHQQSPVVENQLNSESPPERSQTPNQYPQSHQPSNYNINQQSEKLQRFFETNSQKLEELTHELSNGSGYVGYTSILEYLQKVLTVQKIQLLWKGKNILQSEDYFEILDQKIKEYVATYLDEQISLLKTEFALADLKSFLFFLVSRDQLLVQYQMRERVEKQKPNQQETNNEEEQQGLKEELQSTINKYEKLLNSTNNATQKRILIQTLDKLKQQLKSFDEKSSQEEIEKQENLLNQKNSSIAHLSTRNCLEIIFEHYCKQTYAAGKHPTFERIQYQSNILNVNKFMVFCKDFLLLSKELKMPDLLEIFKKNSENYKEMNLSQFESALKKISERMFPQSQNKIDDLYAFMEIENQNKFRTKLKTLRIPFSIKQKKKIVPTDYKFKFISHGGKLPEEIKSLIEERKRQKLQKKKKQEQNRKKPPRPQKPLQQIHHLNQVSPPPSQKYLLRPAITFATNSNTGYSDIHKKKSNGQLTSKTNPRNTNQSTNSYKLNNVVQEAKHYLRHPTQEAAEHYEDTIDQKAYLDSLIQDQQEDDYLTQHWKIQQSNRQAISTKLTNRIQQIQKMELERDRRLYSKVGSGKNMQNQYS